MYEKGVQTAEVIHVVDDRSTHVVIISEADLLRDCLTWALKARGREVVAVSTIDEFEAHVDEGRDRKGNGCIVIFCIGAAKIAEAAVSEGLARIKDSDAVQAVLINGEIDSVDQVLGSIRRGARGYIPSSTPLTVAVEVLNLVQAGGSFLPVATVMAAHDGRAEPVDRSGEVGVKFTDTQMSVIKAMRLGKANKVIAYELNMCESTVKVHVRNIMRKLKASNRTEVAYLTRSMFSDDCTELAS